MNFLSWAVQAEAVQPFARGSEMGGLTGSPPGAHALSEPVTLASFLNVFAVLLDNRMLNKTAYRLYGWTAYGAHIAQKEKRVELETMRNPIV